jgi:hypothetical protein
MQMYTYIFEGVNCEIKTPGVTDFSQVKKEIVQSANKIVNRSTYPSGLVLQVEQEAKKITVYSNRPLTRNPDGSYTAPES